MRRLESIRSVRKPNPKKNNNFILETYIDEIQRGVCNPKAVPKILKETPVTAWVDGNNGLGAVIGNFCMELAIKKGKESGIGLVVAKDSNSYGFAGMYSVQALEEGLLGLSFTNSFPMVAPTRALDVYIPNKKKIW